MNISKVIKDENEARKLGYYADEDEQEQALGNDFGDNLTATQKAELDFMRLKWTEKKLKEGA
jgi:hypothetical protein